MAMDLRNLPITPKFLSRSPNPSENVCRWDLRAQNIADGRYLLATPTSRHTLELPAPGQRRNRYRFHF